jgi:NADPH-dependent curcumin reductase CurA
MITPCQSRAFVLASRPDGEPRDSDFALVRRDLAPPGPGWMLLRTIYISLDPYLRGRMEPGRSYAPRLEIGQVVVGDAVSQVVESRLAGFTPGDFVEGITGWRDYGLSDGSNVRRIDPQFGPLSSLLGVLGKSGHAAYHGLVNIAAPRPGETVVVSAAAGAVGALAGQLARLRGCRVVGIAGRADKCAYLTGELGFDAALDRSDDGFAAALRTACPAGIDVYFDNTGGEVLARVLPLLNPFARVPVCGQIAHYNGMSDAGTSDADEPGSLALLMGLVLVRRIRVEGFIISDHAEAMPAFRREMAAALAAGRIRRREQVIEGLEQAPAAFRALLRGETLGKALLRVAPDPTVGRPCAPSRVPS